MLKKQENEIKQLLKTDEKAKKAFAQMYAFYQLTDELCQTSHIKLIDNIYLTKKQLNYRQLANIAYIGETTCFRYRNIYVKCFYLCYDKN